MVAHGATAAFWKGLERVYLSVEGYGGGEERTNLLSLCEVCHLELVHGGGLRVAGVAPDGLGWAASGWAA